MFFYEKITVENYLLLFVTIFIHAFKKTVAPNLNTTEKKKNVNRNT